MKNVEDRKRFEYGMLRQMDVQNASYPDHVGNETDLTPIALARMITDNFPRLFENAPKALCSAAETLTIKEIKRRIGHLIIDVARTPFGNADSPYCGKIFVKPQTVRLSVNQFIDKLNDPTQTDAWYLQSQDGNLHTTFDSLLDVIPRDIATATNLLGDPEAVNLWIGDSKTTSQLHNDNYENFFVQLSGKKAIYLIPPGCAYALDERFLVPATYKYNDDGSFHLEIDETNCILPGAPTEDELHKMLDKLPTDKPQRVMFPTVNPADPTTHNRIFRDHAIAYRVEVAPGEMLYIPALWYHQVEILPGDICVSVNYWYRPSPHNPLWAHWDYIRLTSAVLRGYVDPHYFDID